MIMVNGQSIPNLDVFETPAITSTTVTASVVNTTVTELNNATIPAGSLKVGDVLLLKARGRQTSAGLGHPTVVFSVYWGGVAGTLLMATGTLDPGASQTDDYWCVDAMLTIQTVGSSGTIWASGHVGYHDTTVNYLKFVPMAKASPSDSKATVATTTISTVTSNDLTLAITFSGNQAANSVTVDEFTVIRANV